MIAKEYNEEDEVEEVDIISDDGDDSDEAPDLITSREDFDAMVNTFLNDFEILGRKMKPKLEGESGVEKLDNFRRAMGQDERVRIMSGEDNEQDDDDDDLFPEEKDEKDRWDCETILSKPIILLQMLFFSETLHLSYLYKPRKSPTSYPSS